MSCTDDQGPKRPEPKYVSGRLGPGPKRPGPKRPTPKWDPHDRDPNDRLPIYRGHCRLNIIGIRIIHVLY